MAVGDDREINLDLFARDKTKQGTDSASRNVDNFAKKAEQGAARVEKLNRESDLLEREMQSLARSFADTDDAAERMDLSKAIRRLENDLRRVNKNKSILKGILPDEPDENATKGFGRKLVAGIGSGIASGAGSVASAAGGSVGPVVGGAIATAAAPVLVSTLASVLASGAGAGVIGVGVMAAVKRDESIKKAGGEAGKKFTEGLGDTAVKNFRGPILDSLGILSDAGDRLNADLGRTFAELGDDVVPLTRKIIGAGEAITGSLLGAARESSPALDGLGDAITLVGDGVADFVDTLADGGPAAADNLRLVAGATADLLRYTGMTLDQLNKLANNAWITGPLLPLLRKHYKDAAEASDDLQGSSAALAPQIDKVAEATTPAEKAAQAHAEAMRGEKSAMESLTNAIRAQLDPAFGLLDAQGQLKTAQDKAAEATRKYGTNSDQAREANRKLAQAALDLQGRVGALAASGFDGKLTPAMRAAFKAAGVTDDQLGQVEAQAKSAKKALDKYNGTYKATVITDYVTRYKTIVIGSAESSYEKTKKDIAGRRAGGGDVKKNKAYVVGDGGRPEVFVPDRDGTIVPSIDEYARGGGAMGWSGGRNSGQQTVRVVIDVTGAEGKFKAWFREMVRNGL